ncbi:MAG: ABC transporter permease [Alphaproteobacteria bacterium]|nr:MAG: ABC transporter permease [Alphaproteobacteria bacterium]
MIRHVWLIARHEFVETMKSRTFLVTLLLIPTMIAMGVLVPRWLKTRATTTSAIALIEAGKEDWTARVREALALERARLEISALHDWLAAHARPEFRHDGELDESRVPLLLLKNHADITDWDARRFIDSGGLAQWLPIAMSFAEPDAPPFLAPPPLLRIVEPPAGLVDHEGADRNAMGRSLAPWLEGRRRLADGSPLKAVVIFPPRVAPVPPDVPASIGRGPVERSVQIWSAGALDSVIRSRLHDALDHAFRARALEQGLPDPGLVRLWDMQAPVRYLDVSAAGGRTITLADRMARVLPRAASVLLIYFLLINSSLLMSHMMEEKSNRIVEVLISSVKPDALMAGKLIGASLIALFLFVFSVASVLGVLFLAGGSVFVEITRALLAAVGDSPILPALIAYFLLGYFLFAGLFLTAGAFCETPKDVQALSTPLVLAMIVILFVVWAYGAEPKSDAARLLSFLPFFGPFMLMARVTAEPPVWEVALAIGLQTLYIAGILWLSARLFRVAVLASGLPSVRLLITRIRKH